MSATHYVEVFRGDDGEWRWHRMKSSDLIANSGEGYLSRHYCLQIAEAEALAYDCELRVVTDHETDN